MTNDNNTWEPICPAPHDVIKPKFRHPKFGEPIEIYPFQDEHGRTWSFVCRFIQDDGKKTFRSRCFGAFNGKYQWAWKAGKTPRPMYKLPDQVKYPDKPILVVEGERTAEAAHLRFGETHCITTSMNGAQSPAKTDWSKLKNRDVLVWPDNDSAGIRYQNAVARFAKDAGANSVRAVQIPNDFPIKWDLADAIPEGYSDDQLSVMLDSATLIASVDIDSAHSGDEFALAVQVPFRLTKSSVESYYEDSEGNIEWKFVCSRLEVQALTRTEKNQDWGRLLSWKDPDGVVHTWAMPMSILAGDGSACREMLFQGGMNLAPGKGARELLQKYLVTTQPKKRLLNVSRCGWHNFNGENSFVLPNKTFGQSNVVLQSASSWDHSFNINGTLAEWNQNVGRYAESNSRLTLVMSVAFAAPLLEVTNSESGGFHLRGASSLGKTTVLSSAASIWGGGGVKGYLNQWKSTANALEATTAKHCDALMALDEISQVSGDVLSDAAYTIGNGASKGRADRTGNLQPGKKWRVLYLSTGEISIAAKIAEGFNKKSTAGQEVRVVDVPAETGSGFGIFECIHDFKDSESLARHLKNSSSDFYGIPIHVFLEKLILENRNELKDSIQYSIDAFVSSLSIEKSDGQVKRVANRFGLVAAAGELAIRYEVVNWREGTAIWGAKKCFQDWLDNRGSVGALEITNAIRQIRLFMEMHGESRFTPINGQIEVIDTAYPRSTINRAGFREAIDGNTEFFVFPECFKTELCAGFDHKEIAKALLQQGYLVKGENDSRAARKKRLPGFKSAIRIYHFTSKIISEGEDHG